LRALRLGENNIKYPLATASEIPGASMPYVNIKITKQGATTEQKAALIKGVTDLLASVLGKNPKTTFVVIDEVDTDNWGVAGESISASRKRGN
jgi:4-oxalocrotonate tautomerase